MAETTQLTRHIESFVDLSRSSSQQAASLEAIAFLVKNDELTLEELVREMSLYLTTTDSVIRSRGILLLAEVLAFLALKPLSDTTIHTLIGFFTDRLADWKALHGALVGCLALMQRKRNVGMVTGSDAKAVAQSYLLNLQVQSLGQHDRKLCFELLECLLKRYPDEVASLGDDLIYGICAAIDEEKDPQCLMLTFHIVEIMVQLFPDASGPLATFAGDLFEMLGCYFPIHFTHPKGEDIVVKRDELSRALMIAFSSTPLFEPFAIPLLLEKLSSSLASAKVDSLKYLAHCAPKYGADRIAKHVKSIWSALKDVIYASLEGPVLSCAPQTFGDLGVGESDIATEALTLLQKLLVQNNNSVLSLIIVDEDVKMVFNSFSSYKNYNDIPLKSKQKLLAIGQILTVSAKTSAASCNRIFENFFPQLMDTLKLPAKNSPGEYSPSDSYVLSEKLNFGALYLCTELLAACRDFISGYKEIASQSFSMESFSFMLQNFSDSLSKALRSTLAAIDEDTPDAEIYLQVRGLQILATIPEVISKSTFEDILLSFMTTITIDFNKPLLWKLSLKAILNIGSYVDGCNEPEKAESYDHIVVEKIISLVYVDDDSMPYPLKLEAMFDLCTSGHKYMLKVVQGLEEAIFANLLEVCGNSKSADTVVQLLDCYSDKVFPRIHRTEGIEEVMLRFAVNIWNLFENYKVFNYGVQEKGLLDVTMRALKLSVSHCSEESQNVIMQKAYDHLSSSTSFQSNKSTSDSKPVQLENLLLTEGTNSLSCRDEWLLSLFTSVAIAARPQTHIPNIRVVLRLFMTTFLNGYVPSAHALGSIVNKLGADISSGCTLEEAIDIIFKTSLWRSHDHAPSETCLTNLCLGVASSSRLLQISSITGLAWIGKGLLLRGHEKVKDITIVLLECLQSKEYYEQDVDSSVMKCAADAFHILMSDSEDCLNRDFHATVRPLYKQRFFSIMMPILQSLILKSDSALSRPVLYRAFAHVASNTPLTVILNDAKKLIPILVDSLRALRKDVLDKDMVYSLLLVLSGTLTNKSGQEAVVENVRIIINGLTELVAYPHMTLVRETAIQSLVAVSVLPHTRIYPMRSQVLGAISKALDDPKRSVRKEAVRCRQAWASFASRNLHF